MRPGRGRIRALRTLGGLRGRSRLGGRRRRRRNWRRGGRGAVRASGREQGKDRWRRGGGRRRGATGAVRSLMTTSMIRSAGRQRTSLSRRPLRARRRRRRRTFFLDHLPPALPQRLQNSGPSPTGRPRRGQERTRRTTRSTRVWARGRRTLRRSSGGVSPRRRERSEGAGRSGRGVRVGRDGIF